VLAVAGPAGSASAELYCANEPGCTFRGPNVLFMVDYSTAMNGDLGDGSRWEAAVAAIGEVAEVSVYDQYFHFAALRFGHDPDPGLGTTIPGDLSEPALVDGQALDWLWYDTDVENPQYYGCTADELKAALGDQPPPLGGMDEGIGRWTKGGLDYAASVIAESKADFFWESGERIYANVVITAGPWTDAGDSQTLAPAGENPAITAAALWEEQAVRTYVVYIGEPDDVAAQAAAHELALAGGTTSALVAETPAALSDALLSINDGILDEIMRAICTPGQARMMVLLDASSAMLNAGGGTQAGGAGETGWDHARVLLSAVGSLFTFEVNAGDHMEDYLLLGLTVFGDDAPAPGEDKLVVDYGSCHRDNVAWALDPNSSCGDGCDDAWGGPPIAWSFVDGAEIDPPGFVDSTIAHMPRCLGDAAFCAGSGAFLHLGLKRIREHRAAFHAASLESDAAYPAKAQTLYANLLVTNGRYDGYSTDAQVQAELEGMYADGVVTYVLGIGDGADAPAAIANLEKMAAWGSGGQLPHYDEGSVDALRSALKQVVESIEFDPCCEFTNCSLSPEPGIDDECNPDYPFEGCWEYDRALCLYDEEGEKYYCDAKPETCGDGVVDPWEACDDGNPSPYDGCQPDCTESVCGDAYKWGGVEECDDGNTNDGDGCGSDCTWEWPLGCGDGEVDPGEECDDGNDNDHDECTNMCRLPAVCGDGKLDPGEACDDGNDVDDDACTNLCTVPELGVCGDGVLDPGEACDDGNDVDDDGCTNVCEVPTSGRCGDGVVDPGEACDDGNQIADDGCTNLCTLSGVCGDGVVDPGEACDDGNQIDDDECTRACEPPRCGDAIVQADELCDDGNTVDDDACRNDCSLAGQVSEGGCGCAAEGDAQGRGRGLLGVVLGGVFLWSRRRRA
jgi:cysteine-rich repeat protein